MSKRNDAVQVKDIRSFNKVFPYLMKRRCDSMVMYTMEIDMTNAVRFIKHKNAMAQEHKYRLFDLLMSAFTRTFALKPALNNFIADYTYWNRNELSFNFIVKQDLTEDAPEKNAIVKFEPDMVFEEVAAIMRMAINEARREEPNDADKVIKSFLKLPKWLFKIAVRFLQFLDSKGKLPKAIADVDGLHVSAFVANLGSINIPEPPLHHLYEWGTTSVFITIGKLHRSKVIGIDDEEILKDTLKLGITVDERIAEGFYFMRCMKILKECIENPKLLEKRPDLKQKKS